MRPYQSMPTSETDGSAEQEGIGIAEGIRAYLLREAGVMAAISVGLNHMATSK